MATLNYYVACTLDGFIAHKDGSYDGFLWDEAMVADFFAAIQRFDAVLMGRNTFEAGLSQGTTNPYPGRRQIVFSSSMERSPDEAVELVRGDAAEFVRGLKEEIDGEIWLCGGGRLATSLLEAGLIDLLTLKLHPVVFGDGIPLFASLRERANFELMGTQLYETSGIQVLRYRWVATN